MPRRSKRTVHRAASAFSTDDGLQHIAPAAVAYFDVLGFTDDMKRAARLRRSDEVLQKIASTLKGWYEAARDTFSEEYSPRRFWEVKAFTDNVVIGHPIGGRGDAESELAHLLGDVARLQLGFIIDGGLFIRGGVAIGELYMDDDVVYGVGLLNAVGSDRKGAPPRVVLHPTAVEAVRQHVRYYGSPASAPQARYLLRDEDGEFFLYYLELTWDEYSDARNYDYIAQHRDLVLERLRRHRREPHIWAKYAWAARYHNYFCSLIPGGEDYVLRASILSLDAKRVGQVFRKRRARNGGLTHR